MYAAAPLIDARLRRSIARRAHTAGPIAEIWRRVNADAARLHLPRPSYEQVRVLVHRARALARMVPAAIVLVTLQHPRPQGLPWRLARGARRVLYCLRR